ncbi:MAG TPA: hypothetical protein VL197_09460 [Nitrospirota bacterium]|nr:hypothetical protein [Nitrospirota bacterium]
MKAEFIEGVYCCGKQLTIGPAKRTVPAKGIILTRVKSRNDCEDEEYCYNANDYSLRSLHAPNYTADICRSQGSFQGEENPPLKPAALFCQLENMSILA